MFSVILFFLVCFYVCFLLHFGTINYVILCECERCIIRIWYVCYYHLSLLCKLKDLVHKVLQHDMAFRKVRIRMPNNGSGVCAGGLTDVYREL